MRGSESWMLQLPGWLNAFEEEPSWGVVVSQGAEHVKIDATD